MESWLIVVICSSPTFAKGSCGAWLLMVFSNYNTEMVEFSAEDLNLNGVLCEKNTLNLNQIFLLL